MDYWQIRELLLKTVPVGGKLFKGDPRRFKGIAKPSARKTNLSQFDLKTGKMALRKQVLPSGKMESFLVVSSVVALGCPLPLNLDLWDGLKCPFGCIFCFANAFRSTLYPSLYDRSESEILRSCDSDWAKRRLDKVFALRGRPEKAHKATEKAVALEIPIRFGVRFENFLRKDKKKQVSLDILKYLSENAYPTCIATKSDLLGDDEYLEALCSSPIKPIVQISMSSVDPELLSSLEPGVPSFESKKKMIKKLVKSGITVVARLQPFLPFIGDSKESIDNWCSFFKETGIRRVTLGVLGGGTDFPGIIYGFEQSKMDYQMMTSVSRSIFVSIMVKKLFSYFRKNVDGMKCSSTDFALSAFSDEDICCGGDDWFNSVPYSAGNVTSAVRFISSRDGEWTTWSQFEQWVDSKGGFLSSSLRNKVLGFWRCSLEHELSLDGAIGLQIGGVDNQGIPIWRFDKKLLDIHGELDILKWIGGM